MGFESLPPQGSFAFVLAVDLASSVALIALATCISAYVFGS